MERSLNLRELTIINEVAKILSKGFEFTKSLEELLKVLYSFWDVRYSYVALYSPEIRALKIVKAFGLTEEEVERGIFRRGEGVVGKVYKDGVPIFLSDIRVNAYLNKTGLRERLQGGESFVAVPIRLGGEPLGVLAVFKDFGEESVERGVELLMIVGTMIGMLYKLDEKMNQERQEWEEERRLLTKALSERYNVEGIVGKSLAIRKLLDLIERVADIMRTSTFMVFSLPSLSISLSCITLSILGCRARGISPISSKKMVPPLASSNLPFFEV